MQINQIKYQKESSGGGKFAISFNFFILEKEYKNGNLLMEKNMKRKINIFAFIKRHKNVSQNDTLACFSISTRQDNKFALFITQKYISHSKWWKKNEKKWPHCQMFQLCQAKYSKMHKRWRCKQRKMSHNSRAIN
jgi:hypothetical protein